MEDLESSATVTSAAIGEAATEAGERADLVAAPETIEAGVERYAIERVIGEGGMGRVLEAQDRQFGRAVAIKQIVADTPALRRRFMTEARVTATLEHPGVPPVYEMGYDESGRPFYAMRLVRGRTLAKLLGACGSLDERLEYLSVVMKTAQTLAFAHHHGVVHRDVKPDNILVGTHGETVLLDWGIAKVRNIATSADANTVEEPSEPSPAGAARTRHGAVMGTPQYMAPEQAAGEVASIDERTDVFALGAILYHVLAGRAPYDAATGRDILRLAEDAQFEPLSVVAPKASPELAAIVERAMARAQADRFQSAEELAVALDTLVTSALLGKPSRAVSAFVGATSWVLVAFFVLSAALVWSMMPSLREMGLAFVSVIGTAVVGGVLGVVDITTRGRYRISPLVLALGIATALGGIAQAVSGYVFVMRGLANEGADAEKWRTVFAAGSYEAFGSVAPGIALGTILILLWAIGARASRTT